MLARRQVDALRHFARYVCSYADESLFSRAARDDSIIDAGVDTRAQYANIIADIAFIIAFRLRLSLLPLPRHTPQSFHFDADDVYQ